MQKMEKVKHIKLIKVWFSVFWMILKAPMMTMTLTMMMLMTVVESKEARRVWLMGCRHKHPVALYQLQPVYPP